MYGFSSFRLFQQVFFYKVHKFLKVEWQCCFTDSPKPISAYDDCQQVIIRNISSVFACIHSLSIVRVMVSVECWPTSPPPLHTFFMSAHAVEGDWGEHYWTAGGGRDCLTQFQLGKKRDTGLHDCCICPNIHPHHPPHSGQVIRKPKWGMNYGLLPLDNKLIQRGTLSLSSTPLILSVRVFQSGCTLWLTQFGAIIERA